VTLYLIAGLVVVAAIAFVVAPLIRRGRPDPAARSVGAPAEQASAPAPTPRATREAPRPSALEELELDFAMGKLEKAEYDTLRAQYSSEPAGTPVHGQVGSPSVDSADARAEAMIRALRPSGIACETCGLRPEPDARFCSTCGRKLGVRPSSISAVEETGDR
jgi:hypothetical protein